MEVLHTGEGRRCNHGSIEGLQLWECGEDRRLKNHKHIEDAGDAVVTSKRLRAELGASQQGFEIAELGRDFAISCPESGVSFSRIRGVLRLAVYK
jgi:hypothetical protein